jgi:hypothetical protein
MNQWFLLVKLNSSLRKFYGRHNHLVDRYGISVSQMTTDIFHLSQQTTQWPKEKVQKNKQRSTKHTYKTKDRVTRTPLKTEGELRKFYGRHHDLVDRYGISVSQMSTDMFHLS